MIRTKGFIKIVHNLTPGIQRLLGTCLLILLLRVSAPASEQSIFRFTHWTSNDGLSQSNVTCITQDKSGFMWFGTFNGLNRFDGYHFKTFHYTQDREQSLAHNYISDLAVDQDGRIWIGTSDGLNRFDPAADQMITYHSEAGDTSFFTDNQIEALLIDSDNRVWIGTRNGGLILYRENTGFTTINKNLQSMTISLLFEDHEHNIWIVHDNGAIDILNGTSLAVSHLYGENGLTPYHITAIVQSDEDHHVWIGTQGDGLYRLLVQYNQPKVIEHYSTRSDIKPLTSDIVISLLIDQKGFLWIGTEDRGIDILDISEGNMSHYEHDPYNKYSLSHNSIWSIFEDMAGNIWIGTYAHGINLLIDRNTPFKHFKHQPGDHASLSHNMVNTFLETKDGGLWIATDGGGLNQFDMDKGRFLHYTKENTRLETNVILSLYEDHKGRFWVGTWAEGLYLFDRKNARFINYTQSSAGLASDRIMDIEGDGKDGLWLGTFWRGLTHFNPDKDHVRIYNTTNSGLSDNNVRVLLRDDQNRLWVGTDAGLDRLDPGADTFINYMHNGQDPTSLSKGFVLYLTQTKDGSVWVGTSGGLNRYNPETDSFTRYDTRHGLPDNEIKCILEGEPGFLWLSTNKGICRFNPDQNEVQLFDVSDGLQGNEFNIRSGLKTRQGEILFGGNNGFNIFYPSHIRSNQYIPPLVFTDFRLFNQSVSVNGPDSILNHHINNTKKITLAHHQNVFAFEYAALNYISPQDNQYAYKLEGFEDSWNDAGHARTANYTNIDPGEYIFKVKASNNDGVWNETGRSIKIYITPPFWETWWAYIIEALLILGILNFILNYFISRQRMRADLRLEQLELEKMYELDQMKTRFFTNISHEFHAPMTLILSPLEKLSSSDSLDSRSRENIGLILRNAQRLHRMINQLKDIQKIETGDLSLQLSTGDIIAFLKETVNSFREYAIDHKMELTFTSSTDREIAWFDTDKLDKIIYNLLSNAFKFTRDGGRIHVSATILDPEKNKKQNKDILNVRNIEIAVSDTGIGIPRDKINLITRRFFRIEGKGLDVREGSGIGLAFVNELIKLYHGKIRIDSKEGHGSVFTVNIPLDEKYLEEQQVVSQFIRTPIREKTSGILKIPDATSEKNESYSPTPGSKPLILVVEDDEEIRNYIRKSLAEDYQIQCAQDGIIGLEQAKKQIPDLIISDIKMPNMDGIELCNRLKQSEKTSHIPVILLTAYSSKQSKIEGLEKGADAYLAKPFNIDMLNVQIINLLESRKKLRKKFSADFLIGPKSVNIEDVDEKFLQKVVEMIERNISDTGLNADTLGKKVGMSRTQLYRKIRGLTDQTVNEFIKSIRLKRAAQMLSEKRVTITEIAYAVGFNDLTYFARCFRKQYHKSPSEYISPPKHK